MPLRLTRRSWPAKTSKNRHDRQISSYNPDTAATKPESGGIAGGLLSRNVQDGGRQE
jgi:hypothetical protein